MELGTEAQGLRASRRNVVRGAAWSVPVIAVATAAPAYAASPCDPRTNQVLDWDGSNTTWSRAEDRRSGMATLDPDLAGPIPALTFGLATSYVGNMKPGNEVGFGNALTVVSNAGGLTTSALSLVQATTSATPQGRNDRGSYTFTFSRPVSNLTFTITDIDSNSGDFDDVLEISPGYVELSRGSAITSDNNGPGGTQRYYNTSANNALNDVSSNAGNIRLRYAGPISTFTITYWNWANQFSSGVDSNQGIFLSDLTFDYKPC